MNTLEKIRAEIEQIADEEQKHDKKWAMGLRYAVKIIDKYAEQETCDDVVSRQAVLNILVPYKLAESKIAEEVKSLPSVTPKPIECDDAMSRQFVDKELAFKLICNLAKNIYYNCWNCIFCKKEFIDKTSTRAYCILQQIINEL